MAMAEPWSVTEQRRRKAAEDFPVLGDGTQAGPVLQADDWGVPQGKPVSDFSQTAMSIASQAAQDLSEPDTAPNADPWQPSTTGLLRSGNIDLGNRPQVRNPDGSISTVRSISIDQDGQTILIPTVVGNRVVSNDEAIRHYQQTGENLGVFGDHASADQYAQQLHENQAAMLNRPSPSWTQVAKPFSYLDQQDVLNAPTGAGENAPAAGGLETLGRIGGQIAGIPGQIGGLIRDEWNLSQQQARERTQALQNAPTNAEFQPGEVGPGTFLSAALGINDPWKNRPIIQTQGEAAKTLSQPANLVGLVAPELSFAPEAGPIMRVLTDVVANTAGGWGSEEAKQKAKEAGLPEWAQELAGMAGGVAIGGLAGAATPHAVRGVGLIDQAFNPANLPRAEFGRGVAEDLINPNRARGNYRLAEDLAPVSDITEIGSRNPYRYEGPSSLGMRYGESAAEDLSSVENVNAYLRQFVPEEQLAGMRDFERRDLAAQLFDEQRAARAGGSSPAIAGEQPSVGGGAARGAQDYTPEGLNSLIAEKKAAGMSGPDILADPDVQAYQTRLFALDDAEAFYRRPENLGGGEALTPEQQANINRTVEMAGGRNTITNALENARAQEPVTLYRGDAGSGRLSVGMSKPENILGQGLYFTDTPQNARIYGENVSSFSVPRDVLDRTLDAQAVIPEELRPTIERVIANLPVEERGLDRARLIDAIRKGYPTIADLMDTTIGASPSAQRELRQALMDEGYTGLRYTARGAGDTPNHAGIVLWDEALAESARQPTQSALDRVIARNADELPEPTRTVPQNLAEMQARARARAQQPPTAGGASIPGGQEPFFAPRTNEPPTRGAMRRGEPGFGSAEEMARFQAAEAARLKAIADEAQRAVDEDLARGARYTGSPGNFASRPTSQAADRAATEAYIRESRQRPNTRDEQEIVRRWEQGNRVLLDSIKDDPSLIGTVRRAFDNTVARAAGDIPDSFLSSAVQRRAILRAALEQSGAPAEIIEQATKDAFERELRAHYGATVPDEAKRLLSTTYSGGGHGAGEADELRGLPLFVQRAKNQMFGIDFGLLLTQGDNLVRRGSIPLMASAINKTLSALSLPHIATEIADSQLPRTVQNALSGVHQGRGPASAAQPEVGTMLSYLGKYGKAIDQKFVTRATDALTRLQYDRILTPLRNAAFDGDLVLLKAMGRDIQNPRVRAEAAANANVLSSFAEQAQGATRRKAEGMAFTSSSMTRAKIRNITQMAKLLQPSASPEQRILAASMLASTYVVYTTFGKWLNDQIGTGEFVYSPFEKGYGTIRSKFTNSKGQHEIIDYIPQDSVDKAFAQSLKVLADQGGLTNGDGEPMDIQRAWERVLLGSGSILTRGVAAGAFRTGYEPGKGYRYGNMSGAGVAQSLLPTPPSVQNAVEGASPLEQGLGILGGTVYPETVPTGAGGRGVRPTRPTRPARPTRPTR